ncbi:MAG: DUF4352 domain-containing protein [Anaerolineales bacterium]|nr:DUF4352 domain-containing protein [Anaerolineales bacterium]
MKEKNLHRAASINLRHILVLFLLVLSMACSITGGDTPAPADGAAAAAEVPADRAPAPTPLLTGPVSIGQPFRICDTAVTVVGWENVAPGEYFTPGSGNRFIAAEVVLVNLGSQAVETGWYTFTLLDAFDEEIPEGVFSVTLAKGTILSGGLAAGERTRAKIGYEVPEAEQEFSLKAGCMNHDGGSKEEITVTLGSTPSSANAPGLFTGEVVDDPLSLGTSAIVNSVEITVKEILPFDEKYLDPDSDPRVTPPMSWMKYIIVDLVLENKGDQDVDLNRTTDLYARDPEGWRYATISWASQVLEDPIDEFITLEAGDKIGGQVVQQVPKDPRHLFFVFEYGYGPAGARAFFRMM